MRFSRSNAPVIRLVLTAAYWSVAVTAHVIGFSVLHHRCVGCEGKSGSAVERGI